MVTFDNAWPVLLLVAAFQLKHFICDGPLQTKTMVISKSIYLDGWGVIHALIHGVGTAIVLLAFSLPLIIISALALLDVVVHYHIDFCKENFVKYFRWSTHDAKFWWALSADQWLHQLTYLVLVGLALKSA